MVKSQSVANEHTLPISSDPSSNKYKWEIYSPSQYLTMIPHLTATTNAKFLTTMWTSLF